MNQPASAAELVRLSGLRFQPWLGAALIMVGVLEIGLLASRSAWAELTLDWLGIPAIFVASLSLRWQRTKPVSANVSSGAILFAAGLPALTFVVAEFLEDQWRDDAWLRATGVFVAMIAVLNLWLAWRCIFVERTRERLVA